MKASSVGFPGGGASVGLDSETTSQQGCTTVGPCASLGRPDPMAQLMVGLSQFAPNFCAPKQNYAPSTAASSEFGGSDSTTVASSRRRKGCEQIEAETVNPLDSSGDYSDIDSFLEGAKRQVEANNQSFDSDSYKGFLGLLSLSVKRHFRDDAEDDDSMNSVSTFSGYDAQNSNTALSTRTKSQSLASRQASQRMKGSIAHKRKTTIASPVPESSWSKFFSFEKDPPSELIEHEPQQNNPMDESFEEEDVSRASWMGHVGNPGHNYSKKSTRRRQRKSENDYMIYADDNSLVSDSTYHTLTQDQKEQTFRKQRKSRGGGSLSSTVDENVEHTVDDLASILGEVDHQGDGRVVLQELERASPGLYQAVIERMADQKSLASGMGSDHTNSGFGGQPSQRVEEDDASLLSLLAAPAKRPQAEELETSLEIMPMRCPPRKQHSISPKRNLPPPVPLPPPHQRKYREDYSLAQHRRSLPPRPERKKTVVSFSPSRLLDTSFTSEDQSVLSDLRRSILNVDDSTVQTDDPDLSMPSNISVDSASCLMPGATNGLDALLQESTHTVDGVDLDHYIDDFLSGKIDRLFCRLQEHDQLMTESDQRLLQIEQERKRRLLKQKMRNDPTFREKRSSLQDDDSHLDDFMILHPTRRDEQARPDLVSEKERSLKPPSQNLVTAEQNSPGLDHHARAVPSEEALYVKKMPSKQTKPSQSSSDDKPTPPTDSVEPGAPSEVRLKFRKKKKKSKKTDATSVESKSALQGSPNPEQRPVSPSGQVSEAPSEGTPTQEVCERGRALIRRIQRKRQALAVLNENGSASTPTSLSPEENPGPRQTTEQSADKPTTEFDESPSKFFPPMRAAAPGSESPEEDLAIFLSRKEKKSIFPASVDRAKKIPFRRHEPNETSTLHPLHEAVDESPVKLESTLVSDRVSSVPTSLESPFPSSNPFSFMNVSYEKMIIPSHDDVLGSSDLMLEAVSPSSGDPLSRIRVYENESHFHLDAAVDEKHGYTQLFVETEPRGSKNEDSFDAIMTRTQKFDSAPVDAELEKGGSDEVFVNIRKVSPTSIMDFFGSPPQEPVKSEDLQLLVDDEERDPVFVDDVSNSFYHEDTTTVEAEFYSAHQFLI